MMVACFLCVSVSLALGQQKSLPFMGGSESDLVNHVSKVGKAELIMLEGVLKGVGPLDVVISRAPTLKISIQPSYSQILEFNEVGGKIFASPKLLPWTMVDTRQILSVYGSQLLAAQTIPLLKPKYSEAVGCYLSGRWKLSDFVASLPTRLQFKYPPHLEDAVLISRGLSGSVEQVKRCIASACRVSVSEKGDLEIEPNSFKELVLRTLSHYTLGARLESPKAIIRYELVQAMTPAQVKMAWEDTKTRIEMKNVLSRDTDLALRRSYEKMYAGLSESQRKILPPLDREKKFTVVVGYRASVSTIGYDSQGRGIIF